MKNYVFILLFLFTPLLLTAQKIYKPWVAIIEEKPGQIEFKENEIVIQQLEDVKNKKYKDSKAFHLRILETTKNKKTTRFIVKDREDKDVGLIQCTQINKDLIRVQLLQRAGTLEEAKNYEFPHNLGLAFYSWNKVEKIMNGKSMANLSKDDVKTALKKVKDRILEIKKEYEHLDFEREAELYLSNLFYDNLKEMGYNIFDANAELELGLRKFRDDEEIEKLMDDIQEMVEGERHNIEEKEEAIEAPEKDGGN